jgi:hypothetical protein
VLEVGRVYKSAVLVSAKALIRDSLDAPLANGDFMLESCLNHDVGRIRGPLDVFAASLVSLAPLDSFIKGSAKLLVGFQKLSGAFSTERGVRRGSGGAKEGKMRSSRHSLMSR